MATRKKKAEDDEVITISSIQSIYETGFASINGREYEILKLNHKTRLKVFGYYSSVRSQIMLDNFLFMNSREYQEVERLILNNISCDGIVVGTKSDYFDPDEIDADYIRLMITMFDVFTYPLLTGSLTN